MKLAQNLGSVSSNNGSVGSNIGSSNPVIPGTSPSASATGSKSQQQILPLKLRESNSSGAKVVVAGAAELRRTVVGAANNASGYERLVSENCNTTSSGSPSHSRTGSSPAMMQNIRVSWGPPSKKCGIQNYFKTFSKFVRNSVILFLTVSKKHLQNFI